MCDGVFTEEEDYVFIAAIHGSQNNISAFLEDNIVTALIVVNDGNICRDNIYRIICNYYLSPCGTEIPPSSICPEECSAVQTGCPLAWGAAQLGLKEYNFIDCNDTSSFLFPLPNCCTGVGIEITKPEEGIYTCIYTCTGKA